MLGVFVCLVLLIWGINDPDKFGVMWYPFCILGEISIILFCKTFYCLESKKIELLSYTAILFHVVGGFAYYFGIDSIYDSYGILIVFIQTLQIWTLALYPIIRRNLWNLAR